MLHRFSSILIVIDDKTTRTILRMMLQSLGYRNIEEVASVHDALVQLDRRRYALIVSGFVNEPQAGHDLLKIVRKSDRLAPTPFILVTSPRQKKFVEIARDAGATLFLAKPFTLREFAEKISVLRSVFLAGALDALAQPERQITI